MKKTLLSLAACAMLASSAHAAMYLVGNPAGEWNPQVGIKMDEVDGGYKWSGTVGVEEYFCFATQLIDSWDWTTFNSTYRLNPLNPSAYNPVALAGNYHLTLGGEDHAFRGCGSEVTYFIKEIDGEYTLTVTYGTEQSLPDHSLYLIGQPAGEWNPMVGKEMEKIPGGWYISCYAADSDYFAFATQLLETPDWDTFNANYRVSPNADGVMASNGEYDMHVGDPSGSFHGVGTEATYVVKETDGKYTVSVYDAPVPVEDRWNVVGEFNGWGGEPDFPMTEIRPGVWKATMYDFSGEFKFRFRNDWSINLGPSDYTIVEGEGTYTVTANGNNFCIPEVVEEVIFELDTNEMTLTVDGLTPSMLALRGSFVGWAFELSYLFQEVDDGVYMLSLDGVEKDWQFKIADQDWAEEYTTGILDMTAGEIYELLPGAGKGNMGVDNDYSDVSMYFIPEDGIFWFYGEVADSVARNEIAEGEARYFNLQGVEVQNPADGIFIRVKNGRSEKITVK